MKINTDIVFREEFDGTGILFNPDTGDTYGLNHTAAFIWKSLEAGIGPAGLLAELARHTELPPEAENEVAAFLQELKNKGYLLLDDGR